MKRAEIVKKRTEEDIETKYEKWKGNIYDAKGGKYGEKGCVWSKNIIKYNFRKRWNVFRLRIDPDMLFLKKCRWNYQDGAAWCMTYPATTSLLRHSCTYQTVWSYDNRSLPDDPPFRGPCSAKIESTLKPFKWWKVLWSKRFAQKWLKLTRPRATKPTPPLSCLLSELCAGAWIMPRYQLKEGVCSSAEMFKFSLNTWSGHGQKSNPPNPFTEKAGIFWNTPHVICTLC